MGKMAPAAPGDSIEAENYYNMGMFAYMAENFPNALTSFKKAIAKGYPTADAYNNALAVANQLGNTDEVLALAQGAYNQYGSENPAYLGMMVNAYIERGERDKAMQKLQDGIEANPTDYNLYYTKGIMIESSVNDDTPAEEADKANDEAYACYAKAIELKPDDALSQYQYGRITANKAYKISDNASTLSKSSPSSVKP
jgi:tetratricopeptide (TPR) repeat protein